MHMAPSRWWMFAVRGLVPLLYANFQIGLVGPQEALAPPPIVFAVFVLIDAALAVLIARFVTELSPARIAMLVDAGIGTIAGALAIVLWLTWLPVLPPWAFMALVGTWAFASGGLHALVVLPLRHMDDMQMVIFLMLVAALTRVAYGVPTALSALVVVNEIGFKRLLGVQQWLLVLFGITQLLFHGAVADAWRTRWHQQPAFNAQMEQEPPVWSSRVPFILRNRAWGEFIAHKALSLRHQKEVRPCDEDVMKGQH